MRRALWSAVALATATALGAQTPPATTQAPVAAPPPAGAKGGTKAEFRIGGFMVSGERSYDFANRVQTATGSIRGIEVLLRGRVGGIFVRSLSGTFGKQPQVISLDARILLFPPVFTVFGGVGKRALSSSVGTPIYNVAMGGISSTVMIGGTGLRTHISGAYLIAPDPKAASGASNAVKNISKGMEGEASVFYRVPGVPLFLQVGYRTEIFTGKSAGGTAPEEVRGIRVGGGIQFGGH